MIIINNESMTMTVSIGIGYRIGRVSRGCGVRDAGGRSRRGLGGGSRSGAGGPGAGGSSSICTVTSDLFYNLLFIIHNKLENKSKRFSESVFSIYIIGLTWPHSPGRHSGPVNATQCLFCAWPCQIIFE